MEENQRHVHIAVLTQGHIRYELANWLLGLVNTKAWGLAAQHRRPFSVVFYEGRSREGRPVSSNRNRIIRDRPAGSDLIMIDADVIPHPDLFEIALQPDKDVIICPTPIWRAEGNILCPARPNLNGTPENQIIALGLDTYTEVLEGGTGAIYISRECLGHPDMHAPFQFQMGDDGTTLIGEDYTFCDKARAAGFKIWTANKILCGHYQDVNLLTVMQRFHEVAEIAELEKNLAEEAL